MARATTQSVGSSVLGFHLTQESKPTMRMHHIHTYLGQPRAKQHLSMPPPSTFVSFPSVWSRYVHSCPHDGSPSLAESGGKGDPLTLEIKWKQPLQKTQ